MAAERSPQTEEAHQIYDRHVKPVEHAHKGEYALVTPDARHSLRPRSSTSWSEPTSARARRTPSSKSPTSPSASYGDSGSYQQSLSVPSCSRFRRITQ